MTWYALDLTAEFQDSFNFSVSLHGMLVPAALVVYKLAIQLFHDLVAIATGPNVSRGCSCCSLVVKGAGG